MVYSSTRFVHCNCCKTPHQYTDILSSQHRIQSPILQVLMFRPIRRFAGQVVAKTNYFVAWTAPWLGIHRLALLQSIGCCELSVSADWSFQPIDIRSANYHWMHCAPNEYGELARLIWAEQWARDQWVDYVQHQSIQCWEVSSPGLIHSMYSDSDWGILENRRCEPKRGSLVV